MCQHFFRCVAARALIAAPNLMEGAAIFFTAARECNRSGVHPHRGEKTYRPDFIEAGCMGGRRVCAWGQARPLNRGYAVFFKRIGATARSVPSCCAAVSAAGVSSAERMTAEVRWMISKLSARSAALRSEEHTSELQS